MITSQTCVNGREDDPPLKGIWWRSLTKQHEVDIRMDIIMEALTVGKGDDVFTIFCLLYCTWFVPASPYDFV